MRKILVAAAVLMVAGAAGVASADDPDCRSWRNHGTTGRQGLVQGMIDKHLRGSSGRQYTSENPAAMRRCLVAFRDQIVGQIDQFCADRPDANEERVDDIFDRFLLSCVQ